MSFGRWLLIHSFSIFLVVLLVLGYFYREDLQLQQAYQQLLNLDDPAKEVIKSLKLDKEPPQQTAQNKVTPMKTDDKTAQDEKQAKQVAAADLAASPVQAPSTIKQSEFHQDDLLYNARQAFWARDYKTAISNYQLLMDNAPENPDYSGELGNIYYAINDYNNASELYFRTAQILLRQGQRDAAMQLLAPLNAMNRELGDKLKQNLMQ